MYGCSFVCTLTCLRSELTGREDHIWNNYIILLQDCGMKLITLNPIKILSQPYKKLVMY